MDAKDLTAKKAQVKAIASQEMLDDPATALINLVTRRRGGVSMDAIKNAHRAVLDLLSDLPYGKVEERLAAVRKVLEDAGIGGKPKARKSKAGRDRRATGGTHRSSD